MSDYDLIEASHTISALQSALDSAQALIRKQEATIVSLDERVAAATSALATAMVTPKVEALTAGRPYRTAEPVPKHRQRRRSPKAAPLIFV